MDVSPWLPARAGDPPARGRGGPPVGAACHPCVAIAAGQNGVGFRAPAVGANKHGEIRLPPTGIRGRRYGS